MIRLLNITSVETLVKTDNYDMGAELVNVLFLSDDERHKLLADFPEYIDHVKAIPISVVDCTPEDIRVLILNWFFDNRRVIPDSWFQFFYRAILIQPSSGSVERVFSIFKQMFDDNQRSSLNDAISLGVSIRFNDLWRNK